MKTLFKQLCIIKNAGLWSAIGLSLILCPRISIAQEVVTGTDIVVGARAQGMGGAQIAASEDVTAVVNNPADLARIRNLEVQLGLLLLEKNVKTDIKSEFMNGSGSATKNFTGLGSIGIAYPVPTDRGSLVFALAYNRVKDFNGIFSLKGWNDQAFDDNGEVWGGVETNESDEEGGIGVYSFGGAFDVSPNVSVGASIDVWSGKYTIDKRILRNDYTGKVSWLDITGGKDEITAWSLKPSILYCNKNVRFGAYVRFPMTFNIHQDNYEEYYSANDGTFFQIHTNIDPESGADYYDNENLDIEPYYSASYKINAPMQIGLGFSYGKPGERCIAVDMVYENWKEAKFEDEYDPYYFNDKYRPTVNWRLGFEHKLPFVNSVARIGYIHQPSSFKGPRGNNWGDPEIEVKNDRDFVTLGLGTRLAESFSMDLGYAHGFWSEKEGEIGRASCRERVYRLV
jgi:hypothetical protein